MGDSGGDSRPFTTLDDDISAAVDVLLDRQHGLRRIVLWGLCDGASAALLYWRRRRDSRVAAMCLLNPWLRSEQGQARTQVRHYYMQRLLEREFWRKLLKGGVGWGALSDLAANLQRMLGPGSPALAADRAHDAENFRDGMADAWRRFPGPLMLVLSGRDYTAKEFMDGVQREAAWAGALQRSGLHRFDLPTADHTFSVQADRQACEAAIAAWLRSLRVETAPPGVGT
jgi:exosortase A-associated hydrolase 1